MREKLHCPKCKEKVDVINVYHGISSKNQPYVVGTCTQCGGRTLAKMLSQSGKAVGDILEKLAPSAVPKAIEAVGGMGTQIAQTIDNSLARQHERRQLESWYDRVASRNKRKKGEKELAYIARMFSYVKKEFVKERKLNWTDDEIWNFVFDRYQQQQFIR